MTSKLLSSLLVPLLAATALAAPDIASHRVSVQLDANGRRIRGHDEMLVSRGDGGPLTLRLNSSLTISSALIDGAAVDGLERVSDNGTDAFWSVPLPDGASERVVLAVSYAGTIQASSRDVVPPGGAILPGEAAWVPDDGGTSTWELRLDLPAGMRGIVQAALTDRVAGGKRVIETWKTTALTRRFDLALTPWEPVERRVGGITIALWRAEAGEGAEVLLDAARSAIETYEPLLGAYPQPRLDLFESADGRIGRIEPGLVISHGPELETPEIHIATLAAWFGGALGDDHGRSAWADGLRLYVRRHVAVEQRDPIAARRFRTEMCTAAAGGAVSGFDALRTAAAFHGLRRECGDDAFLQTLREITTGRAGESLTWDDWREELSERAGRDLTAPVAQWAFRPGVPHLLLSDVRLDTAGGRQRVAGTIRQILQPGDAPWRLAVPVVVETSDGREETLVEVSGKETGFTILVPSMALRVALDPDVVVPRQIDPGRPTVWRPVLPDVRRGSDPRRITSLMRRLRETSKPRQLVVEELRIAGFDVEEQEVESSLLSRGEGTGLVADGAAVPGALPVTSSPRTPDEGVVANGIALDPGEDLAGRALLLDLPSETPDVHAFVRGAAGIAAVSRARLLILRLPENTPPAYTSLWLTPSDGDGPDRDTPAMHAQLRRWPTLPLPTLVVPHAFAGAARLRAHIRWDVRQLDATLVSLKIEAKRGREGDIVVAARLPDESDQSAAIALVEAVQILAAHSDLLGRSVRVLFLPRGAGAVPAEDRIARERAAAPAAPALTIGRVGDRGISSAVLRATEDAAWLRRIVSSSLERATVPTAETAEAESAATRDVAALDVGDLTVAITSAGPDGPGSEPGAKKIGRVARGIALAILAASIAP